MRSSSTAASGSAQIAYHGQEPGGDDEEPARGERQPRPAAPGLTQKPEVGDGERDGEDRSDHLRRQPGRLNEPVREGTASHLAEVLRHRAEGGQPVAAVPPEGNAGDESRRSGQSRPRQPAAVPPVGKQLQREKRERHPLDRDRRHPGGAGELPPTRGSQGESADHEDHHQRVVVPPSGEVEGKHGIPPDQGGRERGPGPQPRCQEDEDEDCSRAERLVEPGCGSRRVSGHRRVALRKKREARPVGGRCLVPVSAHARDTRDRPGTRWANRRTGSHRAPQRFARSPSRSRRRWSGARAQPEGEAGRRPPQRARR